MILALNSSGAQFADFGARRLLKIVMAANNTIPPIPIQSHGAVLAGVVSAGGSGAGVGGGAAMGSLKGRLVSPGKRSWGRPAGLVLSEFRRTRGTVADIV